MISNISKDIAYNQLKQQTDVSKPKAKWRWKPQTCYQQQNTKRKEAE